MAADKPFPWTTLASKTVVDNKWVRVEEHDVLNVKGTPGHYTTLHFKRVATGAVALDKGGHVFLLGQHRYPLRAYSWEVPEGGTDPGEAPLAAIQRELKEEAGVSAGAWRHILTMHLSNMMSDEIAFGYLATDLTLGAAEPEESEVLELRRVPFAEALAMALDGRITDAITVALLFRVEIMRARGELKEIFGS